MKLKHLTKSARAFDPICQAFCDKYNQDWRDVCYDITPTIDGEEVVCARFYRAKAGECSYVMDAETGERFPLLHTWCAHIVYDVLKIKTHMSHKKRLTVMAHPMSFFMKDLGEEQLKVGPALYCLGLLLRTDPMRHRKSATPSGPTMSP